MTTQVTVPKVLCGIFRLTDPAIEQNRRSSIGKLIESLLCGEVISHYLAINCGLYEDTQGKKVGGVSVYILTYSRLIKINIDSRSMHASSFLVRSIFSVEKRFLDTGKAEASFNFDRGYFGLSYDTKDTNITEFFDRVEAQRVQRNTFTEYA